MIRFIFSAIIQTFCFLFPFFLRRVLLNQILGFHIHPTARIGFSILYARNVYVGSYAFIGSLTLVKNISEIRLDAHARLGHLNWVSGIPLTEPVFFAHKAERNPSLVLEEHSAITKLHRIDVADYVRVGAFSTIAGTNTQILTHSIDIKKSRQDCAPVIIGSYCLIGTRCILLPGAVIPDYTVFGAGSVITSKNLSDKYMLYGGVPAKPIKKLSSKNVYFHRKNGFVK